MTEILGGPIGAARFLVTAFLAVVFLQSAADKVIDRQGNLDYFRAHFRGSPLPEASIPWLLAVLTLVEAAAGVLCALGVVTGAWIRPGWNLASAGLAASGVAFVCLITGQRLAKDYAGAAVVAAYFAVDLVGLALFAVS